MSDLLDHNMVSLDQIDAEVVMSFLKDVYRALPLALVLTGSLSGGLKYAYTHAARGQFTEVISDNVKMNRYEIKGDNVEMQVSINKDLDNALLPASITMFGLAGVLTALRIRKGYSPAP